MLLGLYKQKSSSSLEQKFEFFNRNKDCSLKIPRYKTVYKHKAF